MQAIIYEHEQDLEELLGYLLSKAGFTHTFAENINEFKHLCSEHQPELMLLGTCPPYLNHLENALALRAEFPDCHLLVLTTSRKEYKEINRLEDEGFTCLEVPFPPKMLTQKLTQIKDSSGPVGKS